MYEQMRLVSSKSTSQTEQNGTNAEHDYLFSQISNNERGKPQEALGDESLPGVDDGDELWLERGAAHQEPINIRLAGQLLAVIAVH